MSNLRKNIEALVGSIEKQIDKSPTCDGEDEHYDGQVEGALMVLIEVRKRLKNILSAEDVKLGTDKPKPLKAQIINAYGKVVGEVG